MGGFMGSALVIKWKYDVCLKNIIFKKTYIYNVNSIDTKMPWNISSGYYQPQVSTSSGSGLVPLALRYVCLC